MLGFVIIEENFYNKKTFQKLTEAHCPFRKIYFNIGTK